MTTDNSRAAVRVCAIADAECSRNCGTGPCKRESPCQTCNGNGMIGGPSFYAPDEGGEPCPECAVEQHKAAGQWVHCSPALLNSGVSCALTPRRACECGKGGHDHFIAHGEQHEAAPADRRHIGDSKFEGWYADYAAKGETNPKQIARDAYAAGMGDMTPQPAPSAPLEGTGNGADNEYQVSIDVRDLFSYLRAAWREGQHYDREDTPDQADSWSAASDYANKTIDRWTSMQPIVSRAPRTEVAGAVVIAWVRADDPREAISDEKKRDMIAHAGTPGKKLAECYSIPAFGDPPSADAAAAPAAERAAFEEKFPMPSQTERCGNGYAATGYNAWDAHKFIARWEGWKARAAASQPATTRNDHICHDGEDCHACDAERAAAAGQEVAQYQYRLVTPDYEGEWHNCSAEKARTLQEQVYPEGYKVRALGELFEPARLATRHGLTDLLRQAREELSNVEWENDPPNRVVELFSAIDALLEGAKQ